jgi:hypothetical protein
VPCDYVFVHPTPWLADAHAASLATTDTDAAIRSIFTAARLSAFLFLVLAERGQGRFVDVAGGYGLLTRLMRDLGFDYYWSDLYSPNLFARGFEYGPHVGPCTAISAVEALEHMPNPLVFLRDSLVTHQSDTLLLTTEVFPDGRPLAPSQWQNYYSFETGQHVSFFSARGLDTLARRLGLTYTRAGRLHILSRRHMPRALVRLASHRLLVAPLALMAARMLGSRRTSDQALLSRLLRGEQHPSITS